MILKIVPNKIKKIWIPNKTKQMILEILPLLWEKEEDLEVNNKILRKFFWEE